MTETDPYGWRMTSAGLALIASAITSNTPIGIATLVLGDGGGTVPPASATGIVNEVWRGPVSTVRRAPDNPLLVEVQAVVPVAAGPFVIREAAILSADGTPLALCRRSDLYKGGPAETHTIDLLARIAVSDAAVIDMTVDSGTYATLMAVSAAISDHANSRNHPDATETAKGFTRLATVAEARSGQLATVAVHPAGLKAALTDLVNAAPGALDTLGELAAALGNDASFAATVANQLALKAPLSSPALTGTPTAPTPAAGDSSTRLATTEFVSAAAAAVSWSPHYISGLLLSVTATAVTVGTGGARDVADSTNLRLMSPLTGTLQASGGWAAGAGASKLDTGSRATNTWYHVYLIGGAGQPTDILFSVSLSPAIPAGYTVRRRVGSVLTDGGGNIVPIINHVGGHITWGTPRIDLSGAPPGNLVLSVPPGVRCYARGIIQIQNSFNTPLIRPTDAAASSLYGGSFWIASIAGSGPWSCITDAARQIHISNANYAGLSTDAYLDPREGY
ncbi:phage tail protein [Novispirillum itersonii]|uniref:phage tail protein n=1 Tax=Novispirillum itersonii TaxID=189 RepID=UPI00036157D3|nr:phage tail protein [Novispirillum itersonii]